MKTLEEIMESESQVGKNLEENVFFPDKESGGECYYYYKCGSDVRSGCSDEDKR